MISDIVRVVFPLLASAAVVIGATNAIHFLIIIVTVILFFISFNLPSIKLSEIGVAEELNKSIRSNRNFLFVLTLEFFDSFSSSQLFVFLPLVLLTKGLTLESSLLVQSTLFVGYMVGRWLIGFMAMRLSGLMAIAYAEIGMVVTIILLLIISQTWWLYGLSFALGIFARGTSPAIKALAFDSLLESQMKQGSAVHVVAGDSGGALAQFSFGFLVAWFGTSSPFIVGAGIGTLIAMACFVYNRRLSPRYVS